MAQRHLSSASIATLLCRKTTSVALADGVYCLHNRGSSAILRLNMISGGWGEGASILVVMS